MKVARALVGLCVSVLFAPGLTADGWNVNSRYTVESVGFAEPDGIHTSRSLAAEMARLIGEKLNVEALNELARRIMGELHAQRVSFKLARGAVPEHVRVVFDVERLKGNFDVAVPKIVYYSNQGWSGAGDVTATFGANRLSLGGVSDSDQLIERFSGIRARYERLGLGSERLRFSFEFDDYLEDYDPSTLAALHSANSGLSAYRSRRTLEPAVTFIISRTLTFTSGVRFATLRPDFPAARSESSNAVVNTLRYRRHWETSDTIQHFFEAGYNLRAATRTLGSSTAYTRHRVDAAYSYKHGPHVVELNASAGFIHGQAPLFERFILGNSTTLRGWSKFDADPLGGDRSVYGSAGYGYHVFRVFYDAGSVWDRGTTPTARQSAGVGFRKDAFFLAVAFPIRQSHVEPVFLAGMNY